MRNLEELLKESAASHGHHCAGQVLGVRLAMAGCREVGIDEPKGCKKLVVLVEIDRCATDAIQAVTGCSLGKRTLKFLDYGKMAATFVNTETQLAVRVLAKDDARELARLYAPVPLPLARRKSRPMPRCRKNCFFRSSPPGLTLRRKTCRAFAAPGLSAHPAAKGLISVGRFAWASALYAYLALREACVSAQRTATVRK